MEEVEETATNENSQFTSVDSNIVFVLNRPMQSLSVECCYNS